MTKLEQMAAGCTCGSQRGRGPHKCSCGLLPRDELHPVYAQEYLDAFPKRESVEVVGPAESPYTDSSGLQKRGYAPKILQKKLEGNWDERPVQVGKRTPRPYPRPEFVRSVKQKPVVVVTEPTPPRAEVLDEARGLITGDRNKSYGSPTANFQHIADLWTVQFGHMLKEGERFTPAHVAQAQIHVKQARLIAQPKRDNYVDIAGYAACGWEAQEETK